jgi:hypothetical protein
MNEEDWAKLAELLNEILDLPGSWEQKKTEFDRAMAEHNGTEALEEIVSWYTN